MDTGITIIGAIGLALCLAPFIISNIKNRKKDSKIQKTISDYASQNGFKISEFEIKPKYAVGIDKDNAKLFYLNLIEEAHSQNVEMIDLSEIDTSKIQIEKHYKAAPFERASINCATGYQGAKPPPASHIQAAYS